MTMMSGEIIYLSPTYAGCNHDKNICNEENLGSMWNIVGNQI
jgi:hypothetical protein